MLTLALAACHGGGGPRAIGNVAAPAPRVDLMAGLFAGSRPLVYEVTQVESHWDRHDPAAAPDGMVTTTTTNQVKCDLDVARLGRYRTATIECYDDGDGATVEAPVRQAFERTFVTDGTRLWRLAGGEAPTTVAELVAALPATPDLVIGQRPVTPRGPAGPRADDHASDHGDDAPRPGASHRVTAAGDGWCVADDRWGGEQEGQAWCLSASRGVTTATWHYAGLSTMDQRAELRP
jgi:hypothetical protein